MIYNSTCLFISHTFHLLWVYISIRGPTKIMPSFRATTDLDSTPSETLSQLISPLAFISWHLSVEVESCCWDLWCWAGHFAAPGMSIRPPVSSKLCKLRAIPSVQCRQITDHCGLFRCLNVTFIILPDTSSQPLDKFLVLLIALTLNSCGSA